MSKILNKIKKNRLTLDSYINLCLYKYNESFYEKKHIFGPRGNFITSPYISSIFGEIVAIYIINHFLKKKIFNFSILEIGAGEGIMAQDIIKTIKKFKEINFSYTIIEKSKNLIEKQKVNTKNFKVNWVKSLKDVKEKNLFIISNELIDAYPVKHLKKIKNIWHEKYVFYDKKLNKIKTKYLKLKNKKLKIFNFLNNNAKFIEYSPQVLKFVQKVSKLIKKNENNCFLTFDYGYLRDEFKNTLQGLKKHKKVSVFEDPGNVDITYLVNFNLIQKFFNKKNKFKNIIMSQSRFLIDNGILTRLAQAKKVLKSEKEKIKLDLAVKRLIDPNKMGGLFQSFIITNAN